MSEWRDLQGQARTRLSGLAVYDEQCRLVSKIVGALNRVPTTQRVGIELGGSKFAPSFKQIVAWAMDAAYRKGTLEGLAMGEAVTKSLVPAAIPGMVEKDDDSIELAAHKTALKIRNDQVRELKAHLGSGPDLVKVLEVIAKMMIPPPDVHIEMPPVNVTVAPPTKELKRPKLSYNEDEVAIDFDEETGNIRVRLADGRRADG